MYYKIIKNEKIIDVMDGLVYLKYQPKHDIMLACQPNEAQAILSSDTETVWHEKKLYPIPKKGYDTVEAVEIDEREYRQLRALHCNTPQEIIDAYTLNLIEEGVL